MHKYFPREKVMYQNQKLVFYTNATS